jgi:F0F1-type ATP synthase assembly protein I
MPSRTWDWANDEHSQARLMDKDRAQLLIAAVVGALLGVITGIVLGHGPTYTVIWALIGAVIVGELVYWVRAFVK